MGKRSVTPQSLPSLYFIATSQFSCLACCYDKADSTQCPACHQTYCQPHFLPSVHDCKAPLPPSMVDRIAPQCPLCNNVVNTVPGKGPNEAVERHILSGTCVGFEGGEARRREELKRRKERGEMCWKKGCQKLLVVQMKCSVSTPDLRSVRRRPLTHCRISLAVTNFAPHIVIPIHMSVHLLQHLSARVPPRLSLTPSHRPPLAVTHRPKRASLVYSHLQCSLRNHPHRLQLPHSLGPKRSLPSLPHHSPPPRLR